MRVAAERITRRQVAKTASRQAPVGGWNARDSIANMPDGDAVVLKNWFPGTTQVELRRGFTKEATGFGTSPVESLMAYNPPTGVGQLFAAAGASIYDVTTPSGTYLNLPGAAGDYASTPTSPNIGVTGDIQIDADLAAADWTPAAVQMIVARWQVGGQLSYRLYINTTGTLVLHWTEDGTNIKSTQSTVATGVTNGARKRVRVTMDVNDGAGNRVIKFYTSDDGVTWVQLGATVTTAGVTFIFSGSSKLEIGSSVNGTQERLIGKVWSAQVYSGIGGTKVADFNVEDVPAGTTQFEAVTGEFWTVNGAASILSNTIGTAVVAGATSARWQHTNMATTGGNYLMAVNGADDAILWDGTTWQAVNGASVPISITGVNTNTLIHVCLHKFRLFFIQENTLLVWYLPVQSVGGAAVSIDFRSLFRKGGYLVAMDVWTVDGGYGMDDYAVFATSEGEIAVYKGDNPGAAATWVLVGLYQTGSPLGRRCFMKFGGNLCILCRDGLLPMSVVLDSTRVNSASTITYKIQQAISSSASLYATAFGWQAINFPDKNLLLLNVPVATGLQEQYVMNTLTGAWAQFDGWHALCWERFEERMFFGSGEATANYVGAAMEGVSDDGADIVGTAVEAFSYFGPSSRQKNFMMARPLFMTNGAPGIEMNMALDFEYGNVPLSTPSFSAIGGGIWNQSRWNNATWVGAPTIKKDWQMVNGLGYSAALKLIVATHNCTVAWVSTDYEFEVGGVL